jgi:hypothetical protein
MAANAKQGTYLGSTLTGFTASVAGAVIVPTHTVFGWVATLAGVALLGFSTAGFMRLKQLEAKK